MGYIGKNDMEHPAFAPFVATLEDVELQHLSEAYAAADDRLRGLQGRRDTAQQEITAIDTSLFDLSAKQQEAALDRRVRLQASIDTLPAHLAEAQRRLVLANLAWLSRLHALAWSEAQRAQDELEPVYDAARDDRKAMDRAERAKMSREVSQQEWQEQQLAHRTRQQERHAQTDPARQRRAQAQEAAKVCEIRAHRFGEQVRLESPHTWDEAAAQAVRPITAPVVRSLPHAF